MACCDGTFCVTPSWSDTSSPSLIVRLGLRLMFGKGTVTYGVTVQRGKGREEKHKKGQIRQCSVGQGREGRYCAGKGVTVQGRAGQNHLLFPDRVALLGGVDDPVRTSPSCRLGTIQNLRPENHQSC